MITKKEIEKDIANTAQDKRVGLAIIVLAEAQMVKSSNEFADASPEKEPFLLACVKFKYEAISGLLAVLPKYMKNSELLPELQKMNQYYSKNAENIKKRWYDKMQRLQ